MINTKLSELIDRATKELDKLDAKGYTKKELQDAWERAEYLTKLLKRAIKYYSKE